MSLPVRAPARPLSLAIIAAMAIAILPAAAARPALAASPDVVISEVYGGGGNSGAVFTNDFVELFNRGAAPASIAGWSVQYASSTGTSWSRTNLTPVTLQPGQRYLVQHAQGAGGTTPLPTPDAIGTIAMAGGAGKVALVSSQATIASGTSCPTDASIVDLVGYGAANCSETAPTAATANATSASRTDPCVDTDDNSADFTVGAPTPQNSAATPAPCSDEDLPPAVASSTPADGAQNVAQNATLSVTFTEEVTLDDGAIQLDCAGSGIPATVQSGPDITFELVYSPPLPQGADCSLTVTAAGVHDADADDPPDSLPADVTVDFTVIADDPCAGAFTPIPTLQGSGSQTGASGTVTTEGVVIADYEGNNGIRGFFIQDPAGDGVAGTSDGIFIFEGSNEDTVSVGDDVRVTGNIGEFQGQTQISVGTIFDCGDATVSPTDVTFPVESATFLERYEGMLVRLPQTMSVTEHFLLGRFGQITISAGSRLENPTAVVEPGPSALALQAANDLRRIILDDGNNLQNQDPIVFGRGGQPLSASNTLRGGDTATGIVGVLNWTFGGDNASPNAWRVRPVNALGGTFDFQPTNPRPGSTVELEGNVRVAGLNLLNYFDTFDGLPDPSGNDNCDFGVGGAPADCRGADTQAEFDRQWPKTVAAVLGLDADVIGVNEIENDGYGPDSAIAHLVDRLNDATAPGTYAFIDVDAGTGRVNAAGTDAIKVGMLYRPAAVTPVGTTAALDTEAFVNGGDSAPRSRPSIAQAFETVDGARFIVDVNHLKSKGSACDAPAANDGQGNCNDVRTAATTELAAWLASDPTGTGDEDVLIVGDLNSYALEDPIDVLLDAGYVNLVAEHVEDPYSYVFDGQWGYLDYALGSETAAEQVAGVVEWHINSDEPSVLDYNTNFKPAAQLTTLYAADRFRVSDHDPIVVGLDALTDRPTVDGGGPYVVEEGGSVQLTATGGDPTDDALTYAWDLDGDGSFETTGPTVAFLAGSLQAPGTVTVTVRVTDEHGQSSTDTAVIDVVWDFGGFASPSNPSGATVIKAGSSHPVKFSLDGFQGLALLDGRPTLQRTDCTTGAAIGAPVATSAGGGGGVAYDPSTDEYTFVWKTNKAWSGWCGTFELHLADGQTHELAVRFKA